MADAVPNRLGRGVPRRDTVLVVGERVTPRSTEQLLAGLDEIRGAARELGAVQAIVLRPGIDRRELFAEAELDVDEGVIGDTWRSRGNRHMPDGAADPLAQLTVMNARFARLIAGDEPERWARAGDQLYVDFDLSVDHLPPGTRLEIGGAQLEVTDKPHTGCAKFAARFGEDALRFVGSPEGRALRLRGMNARVVVAGTVRVGDSISVAAMEPEATAAR